MRVQLPFDVSPASEPEPDFAIVTREALLTARRHPNRALLIVEVADSSLEYDRHEKARLYAQAGVPEYWIVNLPQRQLEVYRRPLPYIADDPRADSYEERLCLGLDREVTAQQLPPLSISVGSLFESL